MHNTVFVTPSWKSCVPAGCKAVQFLVMMLHVLLYKQQNCLDRYLISCTDLDFISVITMTLSK